MTLPGIDVLIRDGFQPLQGRRVGLITNHTGLTAGGMPTVDVLHQAPGVDLRALFGPEHGIRGALDEKVHDSRDAGTGLPVYSLYGETTRPTSAQLHGLDTLVYDVQDVGCRYYTFISTLGLALEEAGRRKMRFVVLDRPNPIGGSAVEGPVADADRLSFTAWHTIPVRHGLTVGELARLYNSQRRLGAELVVVPVEGWRRSDWFDTTGLTWVNPSPNMRCLTQAALYPGIGLLEFTNLSVGRGTDTPFEVLGAPWISWRGARSLAARLNDRRIPGVRFISIRFTPRASIHQGKECGGVNAHLVRRADIQPVRMGLEVACALRDLFPAGWNPDRYDRLLASRAVYQAFRAGRTAEELEALWRPATEAFRRQREQFLLYR